jgi:hypothetical protein
METQLDIPKMKQINMDQRETLKYFSKWVPCQCDGNCGRVWNFVNEIGLSRGGNGSGECGLLKLFGSSTWMFAFRGDKLRKLEATRKRWEAASS